MSRQHKLCVAFAGLMALAVVPAQAQISFQLPEIFVPVTADADAVGEIVVRVVDDPNFPAPLLSGANVEFVATSTSVEFGTPTLPAEDSLFANAPADFSSNDQTVQTSQSAFLEQPLVFSQIEGGSDNLISVPFTLAAGSAGETVTLQFGAGNVLVDSIANSLTLDVTDTGSITGVLIGDYNGDLAIDAADYTVFRDTLGETVIPFSGADGDGDGEITQADFDVWVGAFGGDASAVAVPEPAGLLIVAAAGLSAALARVRR